MLAPAATDHATFGAAMRKTGIKPCRHARHQRMGCRGMTRIKLPFVQAFVDRNGHSWSHLLTRGGGFDLRMWDVTHYTLRKCLIFLGCDGVTSFLQYAR
jgi:hypothetical protein